MTVKDPKITLNQTEATLAVNETVKLSATTAPKSAASSVAYTTSDEKVATVANDGTVKAIAAGEATITATETCGTKKPTATVEVTVKKVALKSVTQTKLAELTAEIVGETKDLKAADFKIVNSETKVVYPVSKVAVDSKDAKKVTLTLSGNLSDGKNYDVTLDGVTKSFKASDGKVASLAVDPLTIPYATAKEIKLIAKDANGVIIDDPAYGKQDSSKYDFRITTTNGSISSSKLTLNKVGDTATAEVTYKTGKYDTNGKPEGNIGPEKFTITAVDQAAVSSFDVRIDDDNKTAFDKAKDTKKICATEKKYAYFMIKDADGNEIASTDYSKYSVESSDAQTLALAGNSITTAGKAHKVQIQGRKTGVAYIIIKEKKSGNIVGSVAVDVVDASAVATMELNPSDGYVEVSNDVDANQQVKVGVTLKDQYSGDVTDKNKKDISVEYLGSDKGTKTAPEGMVTPVRGSNELTIKGVNNSSQSIPEDVYRYKVVYKKDGKEVVARTITISVQAPGDVNGYKLVFDGGKQNVDLKVSDSDADRTIKVKVYGTSNGVQKGDAKSRVAYTVRKVGGDYVYGAAAGATPKTGAAFQVDSESKDAYASSGTELKIEVIGGLTLNAGKYTGNAEVQLEAGDYEITAKWDDGTPHEITQQFTVADSRPISGTKVEVSKTQVTGSDVKAALQNALTVEYDGKTYSADTTNSDHLLTVKKAKVYMVNTLLEKDETYATAGNFTIVELTVQVTLADGLTMDIKVPAANLPIATIQWS